MKFIRDLHNIKNQHCGCVLTIGNFDGVHRGHQALLEKLREEGVQRNLPVILMLFEPQPLEVFATDKAPPRLTDLREKIRYLEPTGIDAVLCVRFNLRFASYTKQSFITELLVNKLKVKILVVGDDFRFGASRMGNFISLKKAGLEYGFKVISTKTVCANGQRISSTAIRQALAKDNFLLASRLLGRPFSISGRVVHGNALGRTIGFPTGNLVLRRTKLPINGVYVVEVLGLGKNPIPGVANIGYRPSIPSFNQQLEVHLLDVTINLYGQHIDVVILKKLRNERYFSSIELLKKQITNDVVTARKFFRLKHRTKFNETDIRN